jgi:tyrosine-protein phosphatase YwqE
MGSLSVVFVVTLQQIGTSSIARRFGKETNSFSMKIIFADFLVSFLYLN